LKACGGQKGWQKKYLNISEQIKYSKVSKLHKDKENNIHINVLVGKPDRKRPIWRPRHRWEDNIKMDLQEVRCGV